MASDKGGPNFSSAGQVLPDHATQPNASAPAEVLARGELLLRQISQEAIAARAEARQAELERMLEQARSGECGPLIAWLAAYDQHQSQRLEADLAPAPSTTPVPPLPPCTVGVPADTDAARPPAADCQQWTSWEPILAAATRRMRAREHTAHETAEMLSMATAKSAERELASPGRPRVDGPARHGPHLRTPSPLRSPTSANPKPKPPAGKQEQSAAGRSSNAKQQPAHSAAEHRRQPAATAAITSTKAHACPVSVVASKSRPQPTTALHGSRMRGIVASGLAHLLLLVALGLITLRMPETSAGLSLSSSSAASVEQVFEISQPIDVETPDVEQTQESYQPHTDFAQELMQDAFAAEAFTPVAPVAGSLSAAMADAAQATTSTSASSHSSFFGAAAGGNCFCYVIDFSGSMRGGPWEAARSELLGSLATLSPKQRFYIILFHQELLSLPTPGAMEPAAYPLYATPENLEHARRWLLSLQVGKSGREPSAAIAEAISKEPDAIYLLTDGVTAVKNVAEKIRAANRVHDPIFGEQVRTTIHTIAYYSLEGQQLLKQIAAENQGQFIYVPAPGI